MNRPNRKVDPVVARKMAVQDGLSCNQIAAHFGSSDQAVADALRRQGLVPAEIWKANTFKRREARLAARRTAIAEKRRAASEKTFAAWFPLWEAGMTMREMAHALGTTTTTVAWTTHMLRRRYGWFPRRVAEYRDPAEVAQAWRSLWDQGMTIPQIAERAGCTTAYANTVIFKMRCRAGWFPVRKLAQAA